MYKVHAGLCDSLQGGGPDVQSSLQRGRYREASSHSIG